MGEEKIGMEFWADYWDTLLLYPLFRVGKLSSEVSVKIKFGGCQIEMFQNCSDWLVLVAEKVLQKLRRSV